MDPTTENSPKRDNNENSYGSILKGTSIFGGVQIFQILINLLRGKFIAIFLGPQGMGVASLFTSSYQAISNTASLGLNLAFIKEVAVNKDDPRGLSTVMKVAGVLLQATGLLGALACALLSPWLSEWSFGSKDFTWQYLLLSVAVYLNVAGFGKIALLQGLHRIKIISFSSLAGALSGLLAGVPLYYFFGTLGIVPALIVLSLTTYVCYSIGLRRAIPHRPVRFTWQSHKPLVKKMFSIGIIMLAATLINSFCNYGINIFIRYFGDMADVGLFSASNSITLQYSGVVFTAMAMDYFPRLTAAANDRQKMTMIVNRQMEIVALIAAPLTILLVGTAPVVIRLLLTEEFISSLPLFRWLAAAILLKAIAYPLGYITFAKDNRRLFFWLEAVACNALYLGLSLIFYYNYGLIGLGYAAVTEQAACIILYLGVNYGVYRLHPARNAAMETLVAICFGAAAFFASFDRFEAFSYYLLAALFMVSAIRSFVTLRSLIFKKL